MPSGGDRKTGKYAQKQRSDGRYFMEDIVDEHICDRTAQGESDAAIIALVKELTGEQITSERIHAVRGTVLAQRRIAWLRREKTRDNYEPKTPQECIAFAKANLIRMVKSRALDKDKITACKGLVEVVLQEAKFAPTAEVPMNDALKRMLMQGSDSNVTTFKSDASMLGDAVVNE